MRYFVCLTILYCVGWSPGTLAGLLSATTLLKIICEGWGDDNRWAELFHRLCYIIGKVTGSFYVYLFELLKYGFHVNLLSSIQENDFLWLGGLFVLTQRRDGAMLLALNAAKNSSALSQLLHVVGAITRMLLEPFGE